MAKSRRGDSADAARSLASQVFDNLQDASQLLRLFDFLPNIYLYVKDRNGRFVAVNRPLVQLRGMDSADDMLGKTDIDVHPLYWGRRYQEEDRRVMESNEELPDQVWLVPGADQRLTTFVSSKIPLRGASGEILGIAGVMYQLDVESDDEPRTDPARKAAKLIEQQFREPLEVSSVAKEVSLSVSQLNRRFKALYQMSPSQYLQRVRVHEACRLLATADVAVGTVAQRAGFFDQAHLTRTFRRWMEMTPTEFRRAAR